ncbi:aminoglycoside phosphotransferase [Streptomyces sp. NPDC051162]|uniref:aminoglycoside phosphotransferase n=1 Tax=Streptomyces sp. NPDC051162 TaxID=3154747 RepID=UPI00343D2987
MDDLSAVPIRDVLTQAERRLERLLKRNDGHYSKFNGTAGFPTDAGTWVRLAWRRPGSFNSDRWTGFEASTAISGVPKPRWTAAATWSDTDRDVVWRADEMTLVPSASISQQADLPQDAQLSERWWSDLYTALDNLAGHSTTRVCVTQDHLSARVREIYGATLDTTVTEWTCAHGDLGYANVCGPTLAILDWEEWGLAPAGWDAACLWSASLTVPAVADHVLDLFSDVLSTRAGMLSRLLLCANTARSHKRTGRAGLQTATMARAAEALVRELRSDQV